MTDDYFKRFTEWQNYTHYLLLDIGISLIAAYYGAPIDTQMFFILFISLFAVDSIVHAIFWYAPVKIAGIKIRWRS